jgi:hypothetical protein
MQLQKGHCNEKVNTTKNLGAHFKKEHTHVWEFSQKHHPNESLRSDAGAI